MPDVVFVVDRVAHCGHPYRGGNRGPRRKRCDNCQTPDGHRRAQPPLDRGCVTCGKSFRVLRRDTATCSRKCYEIHRGTRLAHSIPDRTCALAGCDVVFTPIRDAQRCCCENHGKRHWNDAKRDRTATLVEVNCTMCGHTCRRQRHSLKRGARPFCSLDCRDLWHLEQPDSPINKLRTGELGMPWTTQKRTCKIPPDHPAHWYGASTDIDWLTCPECGDVIARNPRGGRLRCRPCARRVAKSQHRISHRGIKRRKRLAIFNRDNWTCWLCDQAIDPHLAPPNRMAATIDHLIPVSLGGTNDPDNLAAAHLTCNSSRGASLNVTTIKCKARQSRRVTILGEAA